MPTVKCLTVSPTDSCITRLTDSFLIPSGMVHLTFSFSFTCINIIVIQLVSFLIFSNKLSFFHVNFFIYFCCKKNKYYFLGVKNEYERGYHIIYFFIFVKKEKKIEIWSKLTSNDNSMTELKEWI